MSLGTTTLRRIRLKINDAELHTVRLVGRGWSWECDCGATGGWDNKREDAVVAARAHRVEAHSRP